MVKLSGDVIPMNKLDPMIHAVGAAVLVTHQRKTIASGQVTDDSDFSIELPDGFEGDIEILLGLQNAAPTLATVDGNDLHVTLLYSNVNNFIA